MRQSYRDRTLAFRHEDGCLVREVTTSGGRGYAHRCALATYEAVAWEFDEAPLQGEGRVVAEIANKIGVPMTQAHVAVEFLLDCGLVARRGRRLHPAIEGVHLEAMTEWHGLNHREPAPG